MKILGLAGYSGAGKTTLIEALLPRLGRAGLSVSVLKQSHHDVAVDQPGKDSWRHRQAGAREVLLATPHRWMLVRELDGEAEPGLDELVTHLSPCDLVLVEGFRHGGQAKIEVWRAANGKAWLHPQDAQVVAVVADVQPPGALPHFQPDDLDGIVAFILDWLKR